MIAASKPCKPTFYWQAALILLPVIVLAAVGWFSLRQDKIIAQHDATERAQAIADDLVSRIWSELTAEGPGGSNQFSFQVSNAGELIFPPPCAPVPTSKPFDLTALNPEQTRLWLILQSADANEENPDALAQTYNDFIDSDPPENFAAVAHYGLGLLFARQGKLWEATERFDLVAEEYPNAVGESGLPLQHFAQLKLFELLPHEKHEGFLRGRVDLRPPRHRNSAQVTFPSVTLEHFISLDSLCSNLVYRPTPLSSHLLLKIQELGTTGWSTITAGTVIKPGDRVQTVESGKALIQKVGTPGVIRKWQSVWEEHEHSRELFSAAARHFRTNARDLSQTLLPVGAGRSEGEDNQTPATNRLLSAAAHARPTIVAPHLFWFDTPEELKAFSTRTTVDLAAHLSFTDRAWLAVHFNGSATGHWFVCRSESELGSAMSELVAGAKHMPQYFGVGIEVAGKKLSELAPDLRVWSYHHHAGKGGHVDKEYQTELATRMLASATKSEGASEALKVSVYLTSPAALFQQQTTRTYLFGSLITASAAAALAGLFAAWLAFRRQQKLGDMKSNFVSSVSHELRAPIASVRLMAESLERGKISEPAKQGEYFRFIGQECRRLSALIENVLDFSRIEQGRKQYELEPTDLAALTRETVKLMEPCAAEKTVKLETFNIQHSTFNTELDVDGRAIQQALVNLIDNAIKHSPTGGTVAVGMERVQRRTGVAPVSDFQTSGNTEARDGGEKSETGATPVLLWVEDHGPGIPASEHEKIFERFYRLGSELRRETQGVGIGLSIVKHIVEAHGGRVRVESEVGQGSRFVIELPLKNETSNLEH